MTFMEFMSWAAFALLAAGLFVGVLIQVEERMERGRRRRRQMRLIERWPW